MKNVLKLTILSFIAFSLGALNAVPEIYYHNNSSRTIFVMFASNNPPMLYNSKKVLPNASINLSTLPGDHSHIYLSAVTDRSQEQIEINYNNIANQYKNEKAVTLKIGSSDYWGQPRTLVIGAPEEV